MREPVATVSRAPLWYLVPVRVLIISVIVTLLAFAISLLLGICSLVLIAKLHGTAPDLRAAYWHIALPVAETSAVVSLIAATLLELRHYRRARTLSHIERQIGRATWR